MGKKQSKNNSRVGFCCFPEENIQKKVFSNKKPCILSPKI